MANRLAVFQSLWAMEGLAAADASIGAIFDRVHQAGFDGLSVDLGAVTFAQAEGCIPHFARTGLASGLTAFPATVEELRLALRLAHRLAAPFVAVIGQQMPIRISDMLPVIEGWLKVAAQEGMPIHFETHRNCITNDLFTTVQLLDALPELRMAADLSHFVVDREMPCPPTQSLQGLIAEVLARSDSFQGRVASRSQIQVALNFPHNEKWVRLFRDWWRRGFELWRLRHQNATAAFVCELGPPDYAITDANGHEMSDRWAESLQLMQWARALWNESDSETHIAPTAGK
jgi:hypothetical protein